MPVNSKHPEYERMINTWCLVRDCTKGSEAVKAKKSKYLPFLSGQDEGDYESYSNRAMFYEATSRTLLGLIGSVFRKAPQIETTEAVKKDKNSWINRCTTNRNGIDSLARKSIKEVLIAGKVVLLVDAAKEGVTAKNPLWISVYAAESLINWEYKEDADGRPELSRAILEVESVEKDPTDNFKMVKVCRWKVLMLEGEGQAKAYKIETWRKADSNDKVPSGAATDPVDKQFYKEGEDVYPNFGGRRLDFIPMVITTVEDEDQEDMKPPLEPVARVNISHFQSSADLEHGRHYTALPTPYVTGAGKGALTLKIGSQTAWMIGEEKAKVGMLEFTGQGLQALENALEHKEKLMAVLGARLLEEPKRQVEASETHAIRRAGEESVLASIARAVSIGLNKVIEFAKKWDTTIPDATIQLNTDYGMQVLDAQRLAELVKSWQANAISYKTLFHNLEAGEMYPEGHTQDDEEGLLEEDAAKSLKKMADTQMALEGSGEEDEEEETEE